MARRKIRRADEHFYIVDACFLANGYIPIRRLPPDERHRVERCREWWAEIKRQQRKGTAVVYIPDVCIAEAFKVLAKKHIREHRFASSSEYVRYKNRLSDEITIPIKDLKKPRRKVRFHDISTTRDIIISVDRFLEVFMRRNLDVNIADLIVLATAKYLIDFYRIPSKKLIIITLDRPLCNGSKFFSDVPRAYDPTEDSQVASRIFI